MRFFSILEPASDEAVHDFAARFNLLENLPENYKHSQEDFLLISNQYPIFVVADGVTLDYRKLIKRDAKYPNPSPAGDVARIFCETVVKVAVKEYEVLNEDKIQEIFEKANREVAVYNQEKGKSDISGNVTGFYAATGAFIVVKGEKAFWASICDSFVAHFDKEMNLKFMSSGICSPYAVINGEERMGRFLEKGILELKKDDHFFIFTDGFESYVKNPDFLELFKNWPDNLRERIADFSREMNLKDPEKYGHERSLIVVKI